MDPLHLAHFGLLCAWGGVLLVEFVIEGFATDAAGRDVAARLHYWIDLLCELPLLAAVLATGGVLASRSWPLTRLHWIKIGAGLIAIALNLACCALVVARYRRRGDDAAVRRLHGLVRLSALGVPFGVVAAYLGLVYFVR